MINDPGTARPRITLAWAQGLDGSIAAAPGLRTALSGPESLRMTHGLRASHEGILVGIGTVLADDPTLTVRFAEGPDPRPIVLDAALRMPPGSRLMTRPYAGPGSRPILVTARGANPAGRGALEALGAEIIEVGCTVRGSLDLAELLEKLVAMNIASVMVEGGARVLAAFISARLVDRVVITIAPRILPGGLNPFQSGPGAACLIAGLGIERLGDDLCLSGRPTWPD
jgi:3,4-dihydroxy 2-butanone 4-phosphate synthase/GTP cyclohydrolase II